MAIKNDLIVIFVSFKVSFGDECVAQNKMDATNIVWNIQILPPTRAATFGSYSTKTFYTCAIIAVIRIYVSRIFKTRKVLDFAMTLSTRS